MRITVLAPSEDIDYGPVFERVLDNTVSTALELDVYYPHRGDFPDSHDADKVLVTGSEFHVYDRADWMEQTREYIQSALEQGIPVLGVCFGHQILADALGGTVEQVDVPEQAPLTDRELGFNTITLTDAGTNSILFRTVPEQFWSFTSHADRVTELPEDTVPLATNTYGNHAFTSTTSPAYGIQFHPEYDLDMAEQLLENKDLPPEQHQAAEKTITPENAEKAQQARTVFENFFTYL